MSQSQSALERIRSKGLEEVVGSAKDLTFDELIAAMPADEVFSAADAGDGYHLLRGDDEKMKLVGQKLVIIDYRVNEKGTYGPFVSLNIKTKNPITFDGRDYDQFIVNDGGTGIPRQIMAFKLSGKVGIIVCERGFSVSEDYEVTEKYTDPEDGKTKKRAVIDPATGKPILGTTFYLDTAV